MGNLKGGYKAFGFLLISIHIKEALPTPKFLC